MMPFMMLCALFVTITSATVYDSPPPGWERTDNVVNYKRGDSNWKLYASTESSPDPASPPRDSELNMNEYSLLYSAHCSEFKSPDKTRRGWYCYTNTNKYTYTHKHTCKGMYYQTCELTMIMIELTYEEKVGSIVGSIIVVLLTLMLLSGLCMWCIDDSREGHSSSSDFSDIFIASYMMNNIFSGSDSYGSSGGTSGGFNFD